MKKKAKYLGEMLVQKGLIADAQLKALIEEQLRNKKFLGEMLMERGLVSEGDLFATIADQFEIEFVSLKIEEIDLEVAMKFSSSIITEHKCIPMKEDEESVTLAITNPLDAWVLESAQKEAAPKKVKIVLVVPTEMDKAVKEYQRYSRQKMMEKWRNK